MIELLAGAAIGWLAGNFVCPNLPLRRYLQHALDDEAGA